MPRNQKGFTLVELLVVLAIISLISGIGSFNYIKSIPKYRVKAAATDLTSNLRKARGIAIKEARTVLVEFIINDNQYRIDGKTYPPDGGSLPGYYGSSVGFGFGRANKEAQNNGTTMPASAVNYAGTPPGFTFDGRGICSRTGELYLTNSRGDAYSVITTAAGVIRLQQWSGTSWQ